MIYSVINKGSQKEVYRYSAEMPIEFTGMGFATHDHVELVFTPEGAVEQTTFTWARLEFLRRFTQAERLAIRTAAKQSILLEDYLALLDNTTEVVSTDPDTIASIYMMEQSGLIAVGRAEEILSGL